MQDFYRPQKSHIVSYDILHEKLNYKEGISNDWFRSCLSDRT